MFMMVTHDISSLIVFGCILLLLLLLFQVVGAVRLRATITGLQKKYAVTRQIKHEKERFEKVQLHFRQVKTFEQWWQAVCTAAEQLDFWSIKLPLKNIGKTPRTLTWQRNIIETDKPETIKMKIPIRGIKADLRLNIEVNVNVNGSLESAGHRAALFGRLIDEYKVTDLPGNATPSSSVTREQISDS